jgi:hypothetical protein
MIFDIVHGTNNGRAKIISPVELVNFYPEIEVGEKSKYIKALIGTPGYDLAVEMYSSGHCRALYATSTERLFAVISNQLVEIGLNYTITTIGTLNSSYTVCQMCDNGTQILIVDGSSGYIYNMNTGVFAVIADTDFPSGTTHCIFTDGYFVVNASASGQFYFSASYDGTSWSGLDFATAEYSADTLQAISKTSNGTIWMIGKRSLELWNNVGTANLPWRRIAGTVKEIGCTAPYSVATNGSSVFWIGNGQNGYGSVFMGVGYDVQRISSHAIEFQIKQIANINNATAYTYSDEGHSFYIVSFGSEKTFAYDINTGEWHIRASYNSSSGMNQRHFSQGYAFFNGKHLVGSYLNGNLYEMSLDFYTDDGSSIVREIVTGHIAYNNNLLRHPYFEIDLEKGVGLEGEDAPVILLSHSDDGGHTWSKLVRSMTPGAIGEYTQRAILRRLGSSRDRVYKITVSDPVKWVFTNAFLEAV